MTSESSFAATKIALPRIGFWLLAMITSSLKNFLTSQRARCTSQEPGLTSHCSPYRLRAHVRRSRNSLRRDLGENYFWQTPKSKQPPTYRGSVMADPDGELACPVHKLSSLSCCGVSIRFVPVAKRTEAHRRSEILNPKLDCAICVSRSNPCSRKIRGHSEPIGSRNANHTILSSAENLGLRAIRYVTIPRTTIVWDGSLLVVARSRPNSLILHLQCKPLSTPSNARACSGEERLINARPDQIFGPFPTMPFVEPWLSLALPPDAEIAFRSSIHQLADSTERSAHIVSRQLPLALIPRPSRFSYRPILTIQRFAARVSQTTGWDLATSN